MNLDRALDCMGICEGKSVLRIYRSLATTCHKSSCRRPHKAASPSSDSINDLNCRADPELICFISRVTGPVSKSRINERAAIGQTSEGGYCARQASSIVY